MKTHVLQDSELQEQTISFIFTFIKTTDFSPKDVLHHLLEIPYHCLTSYMIKLCSPFKIITKNACNIFGYLLFLFTKVTFLQIF